MINTKYGIRLNIDYSLDFDFNTEALANGILWWETGNKAGDAYQYLQKYYKPECQMDKALFSSTGIKLTEKLAA